MATTSNKLADSSSSSSSTTCWDVFLSFHGKDTRNNFTSHLYSALHDAGIRTFMDDELQKGEGISNGLLNAIRSSKVFVVVLSENYAFSRWCLDELVEILTCKKTSGHVVIPVFYYVDPSHLRHLIGSFKEALDVHKTRYSVDIIEKWKSALSEIAELSGCHLKMDADEKESNTVREIVEKVTSITSTKLLDLEGYLVGTDSSVEEIYKKLSMESNDVRAIGIYGMGGIGKTTTAKIFYNKYFNNFDISCFIDDVKQLLLEGKPLLALLHQLLNNLTGGKEYKVYDVNSGLRQLQQILGTKKALIVLDDMDEPSHSILLVRLCNLFSAGSRIIFTTRDANVANQLKRDISEVDIYKMRELGQADSLKLFSYYAFRNPKPPENFKELSLSFITYARGLPLALKMLGSSLFGKSDVSFWKVKLLKVGEIGQNNILRILRLSYDELEDDTLKAIFLDIAFFFVGGDKDEAVHIFQSCGFFPEVGIPTLEDKCLLTVDENNKFQMHNLILCMGKEVIREQSSRRLYLCQGNTRVALQNLEGKENIEGLIIKQTMSTDRYLTAKIFEGLPRLRLLEIIGASDIEGNLENSFYELRCFRWHRCPWTCLPSSFRPQKLVALDMPSSKLKILWKDIKPLVNLKTINVSHSRQLKIMPDFTHLKSVEKLIFRGCKSLLQVHPSIGRLTNLRHLDLSECCHLKELTEPIIKLTKLGHLDLHQCVNLKRLPVLIIHLTTLGRLNLRHCRNLTQLPEQLGDMKCLKMLDASNTSIEQLPDSVGYLIELVELKLNKCKKLRKLPEQIGNMESLKLFDASHSAISCLPDTFTSLVNMDQLHLSSCRNLTSLPNSLWKLKALRVLDLNWSSKLEQLPEQLGKMQYLEKLHASGTSIEELPDSTGLLSRLQVLTVVCCQKIKNLPSSIRNLTSLTELYVDEKEGINLPEMVKDMKLKILRLRFNTTSWLPVIPSFSSLQSLSLFDERQIFSSSKSYSLSKLSNLRDLSLYNLTSHECSFPELPLNLTSLCISSWISLQSLPPLPPNLEELGVYGCTSLQDLPDLSILTELRRLDFSKCSNLKSSSLKQWFLQVEQQKYFWFKFRIPNKEVAEWFSYRSSDDTLSFTIPPNLGDNFFGTGLWIVYKFKHSLDSPFLRVVITNKTKNVEMNHDIYLPYDVAAGEVWSTIECIQDYRMQSGDRIKISFESFQGLDKNGVDFYDRRGKVKKWGVHLMSPC